MHVMSQILNFLYRPIPGRERLPNQDAFAEGASLGISADGIANYSSNQIASAHMGTSSKVSRMRRSVSAGETIDNNFTDEERRSMQ